MFAELWRAITKKTHLWTTSVFAVWLHLRKDTHSCTGVKSLLLHFSNHSWHLKLQIFAPVPLWLPCEWKLVEKMRKHAGMSRMNDYDLFCSLAFIKNGHGALPSKMEIPPSSLTCCGQWLLDTQTRFPPSPVLSSHYLCAMLLYLLCFYQLCISILLYHHQLPLQ